MQVSEQQVSVVLTHQPQSSSISEADNNNNNNTINNIDNNNNSNNNNNNIEEDNDNNNNIYMLSFNNSGLTPALPDPSPSPPLKSTVAVVGTSSQQQNMSKLYSSPPNNINNQLDYSPVRIRTINSATLPTNNNINNNNEDRSLMMTTTTSSSTAPPPPSSYQYPIPTRPTTTKSSSVNESNNMMEDNFPNTIESNVRTQEHSQQQTHYKSYHHNNEREGERASYYHHSYPSQNSIMMTNNHNIENWKGLKENSNNLSSAEIQKEQANLVYGTQYRQKNRSTQPPSSASYLGSVVEREERGDEEEEDYRVYHHQQQPQQQQYLRENYYPSHQGSSTTLPSTTSILLPSHEARNIQNYNNPSLQIINQKNTSTSSTSPSLNFATGSSSQQPLHGRRNSNYHLYDNNNYHQQHQYVERNNNNFPTTSLHQRTTPTTIAEYQVGAPSYSKQSSMQQQPFVIQPSMQPSSGIPSFHQVHSSSSATNSFHVPSNYQQHHHHQPPPPQHYQPLPPSSSSSSNYLNPPHQQQQQSSYSSPNSNQTNSSEPKLRVYNSTLKVPEGIFSYDNTTLTCEPHGFKPNDRRGAPQTTHSVYVSDVLVVTCDLVNMSNQPGVFQNCTARLVHLMGKNAKKKRKEGVSDQDDGLDSEDDDLDDGKKKKKKNKKKDQEDSLDGDFVTDFSQAGMLESFELLSEQPCQENVQKGKIVSSLKVPRVRGRDCKTKTGQIQVIRFKGTEREHIIAVSDLFWIRSRTRTEMEVRKFKKQQQQTPQQSLPSHQPPQQQPISVQSHETSNLSLHHHAQQLSHPPTIPSSSLNPPRENYHNPQWPNMPNIVQPNSPSTNEHAGLPPKKRRNNSPGGGNTPNTYRVPSNPAASIVHSSTGYFPSNNIQHQENGKVPNLHDSPSLSHHHHHVPYQPSRNEPTYHELLQRVHTLEEKLNRLESKLTRAGHLSPEFPMPPDSQTFSPFLPSSAIQPRPVEPPKTFAPFPIDVFIKDDKRGENPTLPSVVSSDSQPAIFNPKSPLPSFPFDPSDSFLKNSFSSPPAFTNPTSSSSSESGGGMKRER
ncbi:predicted protein [Naegleria gruberi]|uniref:Predicted protein n=1 Tax=Naegleria gruberi TaxID=5762 RepID=D2VW95_NAEGR|nr:uncharacterized protein NAEGRDRAFT_59394 [Naegleria gruberi]EFC38790.1 predicted protein [Naegleria gruberi]|eukprot:XP_002671534.1 predicted protein [Naegleria gruberi strain NEG-M]